jgi:hypothetical protein
MSEMGQKRRNSNVRGWSAYPPILSVNANIPARQPRARKRSFDKIKQCRLATRYDKLAANYLAFIKLASIRI